MDNRLIAFRCPDDVVERIDRLAEATGSSRTLVLVEAVRIFAKEVRARGGYIVPLSSPTAVPKPARAAAEHSN